MKTVLIVVGVAGTAGLGYWLWKSGKFQMFNAGPPATNPAPDMCSSALTQAGNIATKTGDPRVAAGGLVVGLTAPALCKASKWALQKTVAGVKAVGGGVVTGGKYVGREMSGAAQSVYALSTAPLRLTKNVVLNPIGTSKKFVGAVGSTGADIGRAALRPGETLKAGAKALLKPGSSAKALGKKLTSFF